MFKNRRDSIKAAIDLVENETCIVFHAYEVDKFRSEKDKFDRRILLLTNINVLFFKTGLRPKQIFCEYWSDFVGIDGLLSHDPLITLYFKEDMFKFKIDDPQEIKTLRLKLGDFFQRIFTNEEQEMLRLYKSFLHQISCRSIQNSFGQYSRYLSYVRSNKIEIEKKTEKRFFKYLVYHQKEISFPKKIKSIEFESFMYGIDALQFVESISFKEITNVDIFQQLLTFYSTLFEHPSIYMREESNKDQASKNFRFQIRDNIRHLKFNKIKTMNKFDEFIHNLTSKQIEHNLSGLSFENMKLIDKNFYSIDKLCRSIKSKDKSDKSIGLKSLSFNSTLREDQYNYFLTSFLNNDTTRSLCMFSLNNTYNMSIPLLLDKIRNISSLSLENCEINIMTTLQCINRSRMDNLRMLNLSGNYCSKSVPPDFNDQIKKKKEKKKKRKNDLYFNGEKYDPNGDADFEDDDILFPQSLNVLYVRNVRWGSRFKSLIAFLKAVSSFKPKTKNNNNQFRLSIRGIKGGSFEHSGDYNPSLNYFNELNTYLAGFFTDIKKSNLTHLDWAGNPISSEFIQFLRKSKQLIELDVSYCFSAELESNKNDDQNPLKNNYRDSSSNSLLKQFCVYLVDNAKKLESLIILGRIKASNDDEKKKDIPSKDHSILSQNLSGHSIYPLFQAIKETKNALKYVNISGQKLDSTDGLHFFSDAIGSNPRIEKVSFKNTGFATKEQFNYFVSKVKRSGPIYVEWPSEEMRSVGDSNISYYKGLLIRLSKQNFYYEAKAKKVTSSVDNSDKPPKKKKKSKVDSDSDDSESNSDSSENEYEIKFDKLLFGKNLMARKIECFQFDTEKKFPLYLSKEVEEFISTSQDKDESSAESNDDDKIKKKKKVVKKNDSESDSDKDNNDNKIKKKKKVGKKKDSESDSDKNDNEGDDDEIKKKNKKTNKKVIKVESDENSDSNSDDDYSDDKVILKNKKKFIISKDKSKKKNSDDEDEEEENKKNKKKKITKKSVSISDSEDNSTDDSSDDNDENSSDNKEKWQFPKGIKPANDNKKLIKDIKEKFSFENLMLNLVNGSD